MNARTNFRELDRIRKDIGARLRIEHEVAEPPPQLLVLGGVRQSHHPVVERVTRVVAPAVFRRNRLDWHGATRRLEPIRTVQHALEGKPARGRRPGTAP